MNLQSTIEPALVGEGNEKVRQRELLVEILERFHREGENGVEQVLETKTKALEKNFRAILNQLETNF